MTWHRIAFGVASGCVAASCASGAVEPQSTAPVTVFVDDDAAIPVADAAAVDASVAAPARPAVPGTPPSGSWPAMVPVRAGSASVADAGGRLEGFWIDPGRVTLEQYGACLAAGACTAPLLPKRAAAATVGTLPATDLTWMQAAAYCAFAGKRLPTEGEWVLAEQVLREGKVGDLGDDSYELTADPHCSETSGVCGHARIARKRSYRSAFAPHVPFSGGFRCAWSISAPATPEVTAPPLLPVESTSPGRIGCGTTTCSVGQDVCCIGPDEVGRCAPTAQVESCGPDDILACDERADCPAGKSCCATYLSAIGSTSWQCRAGGCFEGEMCLPGGSCRPGYRCVAYPGARQGHCELARPGARCGSQRCSGDTPICCWNGKTQSGSCVGPWDRCGSPDENSFGCSSAADCAGQLCSLYVHTGYRCTGLGIHWNGALCTTLASCPSYYGTPAKSCSPSPDLPPGVKRCVYD